MDLIKPDFGLIFWTTLIFLILLFLLKKFAWGPILKAVKDREESINKALNAADEAKEEMKKLQSENDELLKKARKERDEILAEARETRDQIISDAKKNASAEGDKMIASAKAAIQNERKSAVNQMKEEVSALSVEIAEKILQEQLKDDAEQKKLIDKYVKDINLN